MGVVRAFSAAIDPALHTAVGHGRHIGLAQADGTGTAQALDGECIAVRHQVLEGGAARRGGQALDQVTVLGGIGDAVQRAEGLALGPAVVGGLRLGHCQGVAHHHGIEGGGGVSCVVGVDPRQISLYQFYRRGLAGFERGAQLGYGHLGDFNHGLTA